MMLTSNNSAAGGATSERLSLCGEHISCNIVADDRVIATILPDQVMIGHDKGESQEQSAATSESKWSRIATSAMEECLLLGTDEEIAERQRKRSDLMRDAEAAYNRWQISRPQDVRGQVELMKAG